MIHLQLSGQQILYQCALLTINMRLCPNGYLLLINMLLAQTVSTIHT